MRGSRVAVSHVSPGSVFRTTLALSLAGLAVWLIAVVILYFGLDYVDVWDKVNSVIGGAGGSETISFGTVLSLASLVGALVAITVTVLAPLGAVIYNGLVVLFGGFVVTLDDETL